MRIHSAELTGMRSLAKASRETGIHLERLATGKKINRAADDPSGLITVTDIASRQKSIETRRTRIAFEQTYLGALDGAKSVVSDLLIDLKGAVVAGANRGGLTAEEREALQIETDSILHTINGLGNTAQFNGQRLLDGLSADSLNLSSLFTGGDHDLSSDALEDAASFVDAAINRVATDRATAGNRARELESEDRTLASELEAITGIRSSIEDTDYAAETSALVRSQMLEQASTFVTLLARDMKAQTVLTLLNGVR